VGVGNHEYQSVDWWMSKRANRVGVVVLELLSNHEAHRQASESEIISIHWRERFME